MSAASPAHVLAWVPPYLLEGGGDGGWDLWALRDFETGTTRDCPPGTDLPRDTDPGLLAQWVADHLGYPVTLAPGMQKIRLHRWNRWHTEPIYYVQQWIGVRGMTSIAIALCALQLSQAWQLRGLGMWNVAAYTGSPSLMILATILALKVTGTSPQGTAIACATGCGIQVLAEKVWQAARRNREGTDV